MTLLAVAATAPAQTTTATHPKITTLIAEQQVALWRCEDQLRRERTRVSVDPWSLPRSTKYRRWVLHLWTKRRASCISTLHERGAIWRRLHNGIAYYYSTQGIRAGPMSGHERELELVGRRYGLSPFFLFAASVTESSGGLAACSSNRYNAWGLASCGTWNGIVPAVGGSWEQAFDYYARFLLGRVGVGSGWPSARTAYDYRGYAECSACWGATTAGHMRRIFGVGPSSRYDTAAV